MKEEMINKAVAVLEGNFQEGGFTIPSKGLYPFQWKWDSGFIALGFAHYDMDKAKKKLKHFLMHNGKMGLFPILFFIMIVIPIFQVRIFTNQICIHSLQRNLGLQG